VPEGDRGQNRAWAAAIAPTLDPVSTEEQIAAAEAAMREWDAYTRELMAGRRRKPGHALLDDLLAVEEDGTRLTADEIAANMTFLFLAGHETTTNLIGNGLFALMRHPDQLATLRADPGLVGGRSKSSCGSTRPCSSPPASPSSQRRSRGSRSRPSTPSCSLSARRTTTNAATTPQTPSTSAVAT
jgi:cytochrome P450